MIKTSLRALFVVLAAVFPSFAWAETQAITCTFTLECIDGEDCNETSYDLGVSYEVPDEGAADPAPVQVTDISGDFNASALTEDGTSSGDLMGFAGMNGDSPQRLLTVSEGVGRYSVHMFEEGLAIYYQGTCEREAS